MAKISLRAYNREIEALIEQGHNDEAIAHCRYILKTFPKCLDTYRLLGKGYLEARRFTEAEDILKRLLLAVPDDFIGNLGMSILFDEQKNINNAIWHMERAFEVQPSNTAIQGELRRLYGRRDGLEPPQIRLTRGALAQMYARGNQIPQAIAEIRAMLAEDSDRMDLQVLLARAYFRGGQKVEATDTCTALLKKYPYCLDANRIMVEVLTDTTRGDSTQIYRHRVNALDPYSAFVTGSLFGAGDVPDAAVILDHLDLDSGEFDSQADLGFDTLAKTAVGLSFASAEAEGEEGSESSQDAEPAAAPAEEIPEWLQAAGWGAATAEAVRRAELADQAEALEMESDASAQGVDELAQGEVPDWLQSMAPPEAAQAPEPGAGVEELEAAEADTDWLAGLGRTEVPEADSSSEVTQVGMGLAGAAAAVAAGAMLAREDAEEEIFAEQPGSELAELTPESAASVVEEPSASPVEGELPDWLQETVPTGASETEGPSEGLPDWLRESEVGGAQPESQSDAGGLAPLGAAAAAAAMAASISEEREQPQEVAAGEAETLPGEPASDLSDSSAGLDQEDQAGVQESPEAVDDFAVAEAGLEVDATAEILGESFAEAADQPAVPDAEAAPEPPAMAEPPAVGEVTPEAVAEMSEDEAFAWLESLAARQGVDPNELLTSPVERGETAPEWQGQPETEPGSETPGLAAGVLAAAAVGAILSPEDEPAGADSGQESAEVSARGDLDWLEGIEQEEIPGEPEAQPAAVSEWLPVESAAEGMAASMPEQAQAEVAEENIPPLGTGPSVADSAAAVRPDQPQAEEEMPDWMRMSLDESPSTPQLEEIPEWMRAGGEAEPSPDEEAEISIMEAQVEAAVESSSAGQESGIEIARRTPPEGDDAVFEQAQIDLQRGNLEQATLGYKSLIRKGKLLDEIIFDLREGTYQHPVDVVIWLTLGDAYRRANRLQEALDAYTKAEELLR